MRVKKVGHTQVKSLCPTAICCLNPITASVYSFIHVYVYSRLFFYVYLFAVIVKTASGSSTSGSVKKSKGGFLRSLLCCLGRRRSSDQGSKTPNNGNLHFKGFSLSFFSLLLRYVFFNLAPKHLYTNLNITSLEPL